MSFRHTESLLLNTRLASVRGVKSNYSLSVPLLEMRSIIHVLIVAPLRRHSVTITIAW